MKKLLSILMIATVVFSVCSCDKNDDKLDQGSNEPVQEKEYCYSLYTEYQNFNASDLTVFAPLWDVNDNNEEITWTRTFSGTREGADQQAIAAFDSIVAQINDSVACAGLHEDDYMTTTMQRVEGTPHNLKSKTWRSSGVEE